MSNTTGSEFITLVNRISEVIGSEVITILSAIGVVLNLSTLVLLSHKQLKLQFYSSLWNKCFCDIFVNLTGIIYMNGLCGICPEINVNTYESIFLNAYIRIPMVRITLLAASLSEISLVLNRYILTVNFF